MSVLRIFFKILVMRANFGDFGILVSTSKFWKKFVTRVRPYWDKFWKILTFEFWWNRKVMINHRGGILIFGQILSKSKILDFRVKDLKFCDFAKFWILGLRTSNFVISSEFSSILYKNHEKIENFLSQIQIWWARVKDFKFWFSLGLRISNFTNFTKSPKSKFYKNHQILPQKFLISQILWVLGTSPMFRFSTFPSKIIKHIFVLSNLTLTGYLNFTNFAPGARSHRFFRFIEDVLRIFFKILVMRANFGDFGILISTSKFWKNLVRIVTPYWDQFWKILTIEFWWNRKVMINHRGGILIFGQILSKSKILDFRVKDLKFCDFAKFWILGLRTSNFVISSEFSSNLFNFDQKLKFCGLGLRISNFDFR